MLRNIPPTNISSYGLSSLSVVIVIMWQCEIHRYADVIKFSRAVYTL